MAPLSVLINHHAFIDLETTGLDASCDEVIEVGVVFVERGEVVSTLKQLCRPSMPLPLVIERLTGLTDHKLASQPTFADFAPQLTEALRGWTLVAHNASFERSFLSPLIEQLHAPVLDTCELLHYLHPELPSHALAALVRWADLGRDASHRALSDSEDTFAVLSHALTRCLSEARREDLGDLLALLEPSDSPLVVMLRQLHQLTHARVAVPAMSAATSSPAVLPPTVSAWLGRDGALELDSPEFEPRSAQLALGQHVERALRDGVTLAIEAAPGTGASLGYLSAAALSAVRRGGRVAIAVHSRALREQLLQVELPQLHAATDGAFGFASIKAPSSYVCRERALEVTAAFENHHPVHPERSDDEVGAKSKGVAEGRRRVISAAPCSKPDPSTSVAGRRAKPLSDDDRAARAYLRAFVRRSVDGDLGRVSHWFRARFTPLEELLAACRSCEAHDGCAQRAAIERAAAADVLVIDQSLALDWPAHYPTLAAIIFDEAHHLEDVATEVWSDEVSDVSFAALVDRLTGRFGLATALRRDNAIGVAAELVAATNSLVAELMMVGEAIDALAPAEPRQLPFERRLTGELRTTRAWVRVREGLHRARASLEVIARLSKQSPAIEREVTDAARIIELIADRPDASLCHEVTVREDGWSLASRPIEVHQRFRSQIVDAHHAVVITSATLSTGPDAPFVLDRLGLSAGEQPTQLIRVGTFDLRGQALVMLVTDTPDVQSESFLDWSAQRISGLAQYLSGRVLGLFSSKRRLEAVAERARATLEPAGIEVLQQSRNTRRALATRQRDDRTVLMGTRSLWQGIDLPGLGVSCVFIDALPLEPSTRPIVEAREERLGGEPWGFLSYRLPRALLQLRQGVGRLIRTPDDRGVVVIADPGSPAYRARLYDALDGYRVEALPWAQARQRLYQSMKRMGLTGAAPRPSAPALLVPEQQSLFD